MKFNSNDKKKVLIVLGVVLGLVGVITLSYAFLSVGGKQSLANTFTSGCLNIRIDSESNAIGLSNVLPVTDVEGLSTEGYSFTVKNTCSTSADFIVNLENINRQANTLSSDYLKVSISGDTFDNIISILSSNTVSTPSVSNAYEAYTIYTGSIAGNSTRTFKIREWLDYDATKEQAASKVITNKINVIAKSDIEVTSRPKVKHTLKSITLTGDITGTGTSAKYCVSETSACTPNKDATINNNQVKIELEKNENKEIVCTSINGNIKMCTDPMIVKGDIAKETILANIGVIEGIPNFGNIEVVSGVYKAKDESGEYSYYFRGDVSYNYVKFADKYWRIIRINGDGTIRLIYDGDTPRAIGKVLIVDTQKFNGNNGDNMYVGFKYTYKEVHGTERRSDILNTLNSWYKANLLNYESSIDMNAGFCGDRTTYTDVSGTISGGGTGTTETYYGAYIRLVSNYPGKATPTIECKYESDLFTKEGASKGNKALDYPIGLITADEVAMAGGVWNQRNPRYYLYTGQIYWTMSPYMYNSSDNASMFYVSSDGSLGRYSVNGTWGVRPVINLRADTEFIFEHGDANKGSMTNPYVVE